MHPVQGQRRDWSARFPATIAHLPAEVSARKVWLFTCFCVESAFNDIPPSLRRGGSDLPEAETAIGEGWESRTAEEWAVHAHRVGMGVAALVSHRGQHKSPGDGARFLTGVLQDILGSSRE
jgi:hypothetical protein